VNTEYLPSFLKDLKALRSTPVYVLIKTLVFETIPKFSSLEEIRNLTKLTGYESAYRIRVGDYRNVIKYGKFDQDLSVVGNWLKKFVEEFSFKKFPVTASD
jgi:mRNA interferase RelE/StbE